MEKPALKAWTQADEVEWRKSSTYPSWLTEIIRAKYLITAERNGCHEAFFGLFELDPGDYPFHFHPAPEIYYILQGSAEWTVDQETFTATPGTAIYHPPYARHRMVNQGPEKLVAIWVWWAPGGDTEVLK
ncbi:MAG: cupin domain-containing protein, partial [Candidatus Tectomicrobia bacterium]|nr:cupin domain-containing protein [Candidatus Tectomicrobia bacterium]